MQYARLGDYVNIKTGKLDANAAVENGQYPFFTCSKEISSIDSYSYDTECVLVAGNGDLNVKYYNGKFDAYQRTYIIENKENSIFYVKYIYYFMSRYILELKKQTVGGIIKFIKLGNLTEAKIPIYSKEKQKDIIDFFDNFNSAITNKIHELEILDNLIKSQFIEMFGDPLSNEKCFKKGKVGDYTIDIRYGTSKPADIDGIYPYLRMNNLTYDGYLDYSDLKFINLQDEELEKYSIKYGDVLFNRTNSIELIGKTACYLESEVKVIAGYIIRVRFNDEINPIYFTK